MEDKNEQKAVEMTEKEFHETWEALGIELVATQSMVPNNKKLPESRKGLKEEMVDIVRDIITSHRRTDGMRMHIMFIETEGGSMARIAASRQFTGHCAEEILNQLPVPHKLILMMQVAKGLEG